MNTTLTQADISAIAAQVALLLQPETPAAPAPVAKARKAKSQPKADNEFVTWLRETAPARHERKATNKALAAMLDEKRDGWRGAANREQIWAQAKAGKRLSAVK